MSLAESVVDLSCFTEWLGLQTQSAKKKLSEKLNTWTDHPSTLTKWSGQMKQFREMFEKDPALYTEFRSHFTAISKAENDIQSLWESSSELEQESYGELLFFRPLLRPLNGLPFFLTLWAFLRTYLLPGLSLLLPLITLLAPYFILTYALCIPITFSNYISILHSMLSGQLTDPTCSDPFSSLLPSSASSTFSTHPTSLLKQLAIIMVTLIQGVIQPYWTYKHLHSIDTILETRGKQILDCQTRYEIIREKLASHGCIIHPCPLPESNNIRHMVSEAIFHPMYFKLFMGYIGSLEIQIELAHRPSIRPVKWISSPHPVFRIKDTFDIQVPENQRKTITLSLDTRRHALLTGPNKGGKSTVLRSLSLSVLLAHTFGCAIGEVTMTPLKRLFVCLKPDDLPGTKSRFEREIEFTADTLRVNGPVMVLLDELYHSTNPPDAKHSCEEYSKRLWAHPGALSVISTHLFDWVESADPSIQRICCPAYYDTNKQLNFTYELHEGICKVSSVELLLRKSGLCD
jgi:hypothetical protein